LDSIQIQGSGKPSIYDGGAAVKETANEHSQAYAHWYSQTRLLRALKAALYTYMLFLPDSTLASTASESNGYVGDGVSRAASEGNSIATVTKADAAAPESYPNSLQLFGSWESLD